MSKLLKFNQFINESSDTPSKESRAEHYLGDPFMFWEESMAELIVKLEDLEDSFFYGRLNNLNQLKFNIKIYNTPDFKEIAAKHEKTEEQINEDWWEFLKFTLDGFGQQIMEECPWIRDWSQDGRSGGWLILETNIKDTREDLFELCRGYRWEKRECEREDLLDDDSVELVKTYYEIKDTSDLFSAIPEVLDRLMPDTQLKNMADFYEEMERIKSDILQIEEGIGEYKSDMNDQFLEYMENEYGKND